MRKQEMPSDPAQPGEPHCCHIFILPPRKKADTAEGLPTCKKESSKARKGKTKRDTLIAKVKIAQKQLGIPDRDYRYLLLVNFNVSTCTALSEGQLLSLISFFRSKGWKETPSRKRAADSAGKPKKLFSDKHPAAPIARRLEALLSELGTLRGKYVPWSYAAAILKKQTGLDDFEAATFRELQNVMVALERTVESAKRKQA